MERSTEKVRSASLAPSSVGQGAVAYDAARGALAPAVHVQVGEGPQLPGEELDMDARTAVHVRRVLPGQQSHSHPEPPVSAAGVPHGHPEVAVGEDHSGRHASRHGSHSGVS